MGDILFETAPENSDNQTRLKARMLRLLDDLIDEQEARHCLPGRSREPDVQMVLAETLESGRAQVRLNKKGKPTAIEGSPDLIVEVVSESSVYKDYVRWVQAYHRAGVREYWILDGLGKNLKTRSIVGRAARTFPYRLRKNSWRSPGLNLRISLSRKRGKFGFWNYRFEASAS